MLSSIILGRYFLNFQVAQELIPSAYVALARICKHFKELGIDSQPGGIDSWVPFTFTNTGSGSPVRQTLFLFGTQPPWNFLELQQCNIHTGTVSTVFVFTICLTVAGAPSRGGAGPVTVTVSDPSGTPV
jgi:hypothetical protein